MLNSENHNNDECEKESLLSQIAKLKQEVELYKDHFKHSKSVIYSFNAKNKYYNHISDSISEQLGYTVEEYKKSGLLVGSKLIHPEDYSRILQILDKLKTSKTERDSEVLFYRYKSKQGTYKWVKDEITALKNKDFAIERYLGIFSLTKDDDNIVRRIETDQRFYQDIMDSNPNLMYIKDIKGQYFLVNKALAKLFEIEPDNLLNRLNSEFFDETAEIKFYDKSEKEALKKNKSVTINEKFVSPTGNVHWFKTIKTPLTFKDGRKFILVNSTDITNNVIAEKELKESEARYKNLIDSLNMPYIMVDNNFKIKLINKYAIKWFDITLSPEEIIEKPVTHILKKHKFIKQSQLEDILLNSIEVEFETKIIKENIPYWIWVTIQAVKNIENQVIGLQILILDITERKKIEEELKERENILSAVINSTMDFISLLDPEGNVLLINESGAERLNTESQDIKGKNITEFFSDALPISKKELAKIKTPLRMLNEIGSYIFDISYYPVYNENGQILYYAIFARDITELKKAEKQVKESEILLRSLLKNIPLDFWAQDLNSELIFQSDIGKLVSSQIVNDSLKPLTDNKISEKHRELITQVLKGETIKREVDDIATNNIYHNYYSILSPIREADNITGILGINIDMTHRKIIEQRLRENEQILRSIINTTNDIIFLVDEDFRVITANMPGEEFTGKDIAELSGKLIEEIFDDEKEIFGLNLLNQVKKNKKPFKLETQFQEAFYNVEYLPILGNKEKVYRIVVVFSDITPLKLAEIEIRNALMREKELNFLKSSVISTVSHEFRTPLAVMNSNLQIIDKYSTKLSYEEYQKKIQLIFNSVRYLNNMLDNISLLDKNYRGMLEFNPEPVDVQKLINNIVEEISSVNSEHNRIILSIKDVEGKFNLDELLLRHILTNLLTNALKYSPPTTDVNVNVKYTGKLFEIKIKDAGIGMSTKDINNYWEPFYRGDGVENIKGTGLGSSIVKTCIKLHRGHIKINSKKGGGTSIFLSLPAPKIVE